MQAPETLREALEHYQMAVKQVDAGIPLSAEISQVDLLWKCADLHFRLGELEQAQHVSHQLLICVQQNAFGVDEMFIFSQASRMLADIYRMQAKYDLALGHLQAAFEVLPSDSRYRQRTLQERMLLLQAHATLDMLSGQIKSAETFLWQAYHCAIQIADRAGQAFALHFLGYIRGWGEHIHEAIRLQTQALELYIAIGDPLRAIIGEQVLGIIYQAIGEIECAQRYTERGLERSHTHDISAHLGWLHWNRSILALTQGQWQRCLESLQVAEAMQTPRLQPVIAQTRGCLALRQGALEQAERFFQESVQTALNTDWYAGAAALYGHFLATTGQYAIARVYLDRAASYPTPPGYAGDYYLPFLLEGYHLLGEQVLVAQYVERASSLKGYMYYGYSIDRMFALIEMKTGKWQQAEQSLERGLVLSRKVQNAPEEATILFEQAWLLWLQHHALPMPLPSHIYNHILKLCEQARAICTSLSMLISLKQITAFVQEVQEHWQQQGKQQKDDRISYQLLSLTQREREVLQLVAEGRTDREVAAVLVISHRTVHRHLSNIFVKLDVPGRAAAVAYAIRHEIV